MHKKNEADWLPIVQAMIESFKVVEKKPAEKTEEKPAEKPASK
jgi:hypothetical protein